MTTATPSLLQALPRAVSAEALKLRGTLALWMCLIAPAVVVGLYVLQLTFTDFSKRPPMPPADAWHVFIAGTTALWGLLMLPLFITLESALLASLEHANQRWKHLLALPLPKSAHYLAKLLALTGLLLLASLAFLLLIPLGGGLLEWLQPEFGIGGALPWNLLCGHLAAMAAASLLMLALQLWVALRWHSFTVAVSFGMSATVAGFLIGQSARFGHLYPWSMPLQALAGDGRYLGFVVTTGLVGGVIAGAIGLFDFLHREFG